MSKYGVTVDQFREFVIKTWYITEAEKMGGGIVGLDEKEDLSWKKPYIRQRGNHPVVLVSWNDAIAYCKWLSRKIGTTIRLPTEAEWEYAARGGQKSRGYKYAGSNNPAVVAWYIVNSGGRTHPVGKNQPNELGLYDMSGNVFEWCQDWYARDYYSRSPRNNPQGPTSGTFRVIRGGSWFCLDPKGVRVAFRYFLSPSYSFNTVGFRVVREP